MKSKALAWFCVQDASLKDATGSFADREDSPVIRGIKALRAVGVELLWPRIPCIFHKIVCWFSEFIRPTLICWS
jgi:hypothetical protein